MREIKSVPFSALSAKHGSYVSWGIGTGALVATGRRAPFRQRKMPAGLLISSPLTKFY